MTLAAKISLLFTLKGYCKVAIGVKYKPKVLTYSVPHAAQIDISDN
ncbi:hypothetical protein yaldo0001_35430 [Yersinia aldovae ATCC 35236]|nr:hypothetical protein yaldo0001_35430 [Yersinia aldovae ATCC 35236]